MTILKSVAIIVNVYFSFLPKGGGQNGIVWIIGGGQANICVQSMWQAMGSGGMLP